MPLTEPFRIFPRYKELADSYYTRLRNAKKEGKLIAWGVALIPSEILRAIDIEPVLGEPFGAACAAGGLAPELTAATQNYGFGRDFCAYSRNFVGAYLLNKSHLGEMPLPDVMVSCRTGCNDHIAWFETLSKMLKKPHFAVDVPAVYEDIEEYHIDYVQTQLENLVRFLEEVTSKRMSEEKLVESVTQNLRARTLWVQVLEHCKNAPSPLTFRSQLSFMLPAVSLRGTKGAADFYVALIDELRDKVKRGVAGAPQEKVRLLWDNIPPWYYMQLFRYLDERGAVVVVSLYVALFGIIPPTSPSLSERGRKLLQGKQPTNSREALREVAKDYLRHMTFENLPAKLACYERMVKDYKVQAAIFHVNKGCKNLSLNRGDAARYVQEKLGIPVLFIEASNADPRDFDEKVVVGKIDAFLKKIGVG